MADAMDVDQVGPGKPVMTMKEAATQQLSSIDMKLDATLEAKIDKLNAWYTERMKRITVNVASARDMPLSDAFFLDPVSLTVP